jgi:sodium/potassium-transporting ATPase subunit alpha
LGIAIVCAILLTGLFSYLHKKKTRKIMIKFEKLIPQYANCIRDGERVTLVTEKLTLGDIIQVKSGDIIPGDIRILDAKSFQVDNSPLTGESIPIIKTPECTHSNPLETENLAFFATLAVSGSATGMVVNIGDNTVMGKITGMVLSSSAFFKMDIEHELQQFILSLAAYAFLLSVVFFVSALGLGYHWIDALVFVIGTIIANVPEGLLTTVTVCSSLSATRMASKNCLVKHLGAVKTLGSTSVICSDKTGTLTQNSMIVSRVWLDGKMYFIEPMIDQIFRPYCQTLPDWIPLARCIALCNKAVFKAEDLGLPVYNRKAIGDPSEKATLKHIEQFLGNTKAYRAKHPIVAEIPFNTTNKFQMSIHQNEEKTYNFIVMKGAPERIFKRCSTILVDEDEKVITEKWTGKFGLSCRQMAERGDRILGFCDLKLSKEEFPIGFNFDTEEINFPMEGFRFLGLISLVDPPRPGVPSAVAKCRSAGIKVIMITGDHPITAKAVAQAVGIISPRNKTVEDIAEEKGIPLDQIDTKNITAAVILGYELQNLSENEIDEIIRTKNELVFARTSPEQKLQIVESCQRMFAVVAVTGDGVNDSLAIKKADVGIAMGITGTEVAKKAADIILLDDNFASIVDGIEEGRLYFDNLKKSVAYSLTTNIAEIAPFILFIIGGFPLALGTVTILCIDLVTEIVPAISLAYELPESDLMKRNPRNPYTDRLVGDKLISTGDCFLNDIFKTFMGYKSPFKFILY